MSHLPASTFSRELQWQSKEEMWLCCTWNITPKCPGLDLLSMTYIFCMQAHLCAAIDLCYIVTLLLGNVIRLVEKASTVILSMHQLNLELFYLILFTHILN